MMSMIMMLVIMVAMVVVIVVTEVVLVPAFLGEQTPLLMLICLIWPEMKIFKIKITRKGRSKGKLSPLLAIECALRLPNVTTKNYTHVKLAEILTSINHMPSPGLYSSNAFVVIKALPISSSKSHIVLNKPHVWSLYVDE